MEIKSKKAQEEIVGFSLIVIVVAVILLIFIAYSLKSPQKENVESYEVESFLQSFLQYTSDCRDESKSQSVQDLIYSCINNDDCIDGRDSCEALNSTTISILDESWKVGGDRPIEGYEMAIKSYEDEIIILKKGDVTANSRGSAQYLPNSVEISFKAYFKS